MNYNAYGQRIGVRYTFRLSAPSSAIAMGTLMGYTKAFCYDQSGRLICERKIGNYYGEGTASEQTVFLYDESGIIGMMYTGTDDETDTYYFRRNLLGDVIGIYDTTGTKVGGYAYDAWGNCTITLNTNGIATKNPIRYRGYYYDQDTGLYYLNARYYSPTWRRFISPDDTNYLDPEIESGLNLYCYCNNDPVNYADPSGHWIETVFDMFSLGVSVVDVVINPADPFAWAGLVGDSLDLIPFVTGVGEAVKGVRIVAKGVDVMDDAYDTIRFVKAANHIDDFADGGMDLVRALDKTSEGFTISNRLDGIRIHHSFMRNGMTIPGSRLRVDGLDRITHVIYELKPYNSANLRKGVKQILNYKDKLGTAYKMVIVFY